MHITYLSFYIYKEPKGKKNKLIKLKFIDLKLADCTIKRVLKSINKNLSEFEEKSTKQKTPQREKTVEIVSYFFFFITLIHLIVC